MDRQDRAGIVLAGGYSIRFGDREKALAPVDGEPMLVRVVTQLGAVVDDVVINCRTDQREGFEDALADVSIPVQFAVDSVPDQGPLAGLATGLETVETEYVAVVACDMPTLVPAFVAALFERAAGHDAAVPEDQEGRLQPVQAVYRTDAIAAAAKTELAAGHRSLQRVLNHLNVVVISPEEVSDQAVSRSLHDVNTQEALTELDEQVLE